MCKAGKVGWVSLQRVTSYHCSPWSVLGMEELLLSLTPGGIAWPPPATQGGFRELWTQRYLHPSVASNLTGSARMKCGAPQQGAPSGPHPPHPHTWAPEGCVTFSSQTQSPGRWCYKDPPVRNISLLWQGGLSSGTAGLAPGGLSAFPTTPEALQGRLRGEQVCYTCDPRASMELSFVHRTSCLQDKPACCSTGQRAQAWRWSRRWGRLEASPDIWLCKAKGKH